MTLKTACESQCRPITFFFLNYCVFNFVGLLTQSLNTFLCMICDTDLSSYDYRLPRYKSSYADRNTTAK